MKHAECPNCSSIYSNQNPPKKLKNCEHLLCYACIPVVPKCPIDNRRVEYRRYTAKAFQIDQQLLDSILEAEKQTQKQPRRSINDNNQKPQFETCLLHSKPADLICYDDGKIICANCALFGEHKGHTVKNSEDFIQELTSFTEQALGSFDQLKEGEENLSEEIVKNYIEDQFRQLRAKQLKNIKSGFNKLIEKIRKAEKTAITNLDKEIKNKKQELMKQVSLKDLEDRKKQWYLEIQLLGQVTQQAYMFRNITDALKYIDGNSSESFLLKRGQYLQLQLSTSQNVIKSKIDKTVASITAFFDEPEFQKGLQKYCHFGQTNEKKENSPCGKINSQKKEEQRNEEDFLLETQNSPSKDRKTPNSYQSSGRNHKFNDLGLSSNEKRQKLSPKIETGNEDATSVSSFSTKNIELLASQSVAQMPTYNMMDQYHSRGYNDRNNRSKSRKKDHNIPNIVSARSILNSVEFNNQINKKKKKVEVPQKYRQVLDDLKHDRCQVIDFGGAELGDTNIHALCQYIEKTTKLRNLKLVRNKITDDAMKDLLNACFCSKVTSLNLGQNSLTEKTLQLFENYDLGELRNITLSLNKINRRNVKGRLDEFVKRGITLSI